MVRGKWSLILIKLVYAVIHRFQPDADIVWSIIAQQLERFPIFCALVPKAIVMQLIVI